MPPLFRQQAVRAQQQKLTGDVILTQPMSLSTSILLIATCATVIALLVCNFHYTRKETVHSALIRHLLPNCRGIVARRRDRLHVARRECCHC